MPDRTAGGALPDKWWEMSEGQLVAFFAEKHAGAVAASTFWAIHYALTREGLPALVRREDDVAKMTLAQLGEMIAALEKASASKAVVDAFRELENVRRG